MNLFIDAVSAPGYIALLNDAREIISFESLEVQGNESQKLGDAILFFLKKYRISFEQLQEVVVVNGPGSFTGIRTIVLIVNTYAFVYSHITITPISYFSLFSGFPIMKQSSKRDVFLFEKENAEIKILSNEEVKQYLDTRKVTKVFWDIKEEVFPDVFIEKFPNYVTLCKNILFERKKRIEPLYIKKPNIT